VLAKLDLNGLDEESRAALRFLASAQALFMTSGQDEAAKARWAAFAALSAKLNSRSNVDDLHARLSSATHAAQLPSIAGNGTLP
jgi:hypothetical protein